MSACRGQGRVSGSFGGSFDPWDRLAVVGKSAAAAGAPPGRWRRSAARSPRPPAAPPALPGARDREATRRPAPRRCGAPPPAHTSPDGRTPASRPRSPALPPRRPAARRPCQPPGAPPPKTGRDHPGRQPRRARLIPPGPRRTQPGYRPSLQQRLRHCSGRRCRTGARQAGRHGRLLVSETDFRHLISYQEPLHIPGNDTPVTPTGNEPPGQPPLLP